MHLAYDGYVESNWRYWHELSKVAERNNQVDAGLYEKYDVKRGLRNKNGTGVLAGLTGVGDVHGYRLENGVKIPEHGQLFYRGYEIMDLIAGFQKDRRFGFEEICYLLLLGELPNTKQLHFSTKCWVKTGNCRMDLLKI